MWARSASHRRPRGRRASPSRPVAPGGDWRCSWRIPRFPYQQVCTGLRRRDAVGAGAAAVHHNEVSNSSSTIAAVLARPRRSALMTDSFPSLHTGVHWAPKDATSRPAERARGQREDGSDFGRRRVPFRSAHHHHQLCHHLLPADPAKPIHHIRPAAAPIALAHPRQLPLPSHFLNRLDTSGTRRQLPLPPVRARGTSARAVAPHTGETQRQHLTDPNGPRAEATGVLQLGRVQKRSNTHLLGPSRPNAKLAPTGWLAGSGRPPLTKRPRVQNLRHARRK